jgi:hypothetical protein
MEAIKADKEDKATTSVFAPPITFAQFVKNPVTGMLFICILAICYLIWDTKEVTKRQEERIYALELEVRQANIEIQKLKEENGAMRAELAIRKEYKLSN